MARGSGIRLEGLPQLKAALRQLPDRLQKPALARGLVKAAKPMVDTAKALAPRSADRQSGHHLQDAISAQTTLDKRQRKFLRRQKDQAQAFVGVSYRRSDKYFAPHAHFIEFGTGPRRHESGKSVGQVPAQPFIRPAFDIHKVSVTMAFAPFARVEINKAVKRVARKTLKAGGLR